MLSLCSAAAEEEPAAAVALDRWQEFQQAVKAHRDRERRFRRRVFERSRDRALAAIAMRIAPLALNKQSRRQGRHLTAQ